MVGYQPVDRSLLVTAFQAVSQLFLLVHFIEELTNERAIVGHVTRDKRPPFFIGTLHFAHGEMEFTR